MVPVDAGLGNQQVGLLVVVVEHARLHGVQSAAAHATSAAEATSAATSEAHVVGVVSIGHSHQAMVTPHLHAEESASIALFSTGGQVDVSHRTAVHAGTQTEVDDRLLVTVVDTSNTSQVTLLVVSPDALHNVGGQILQGGLSVAELLTVDAHLGDRLTINLDITVIVDLGTRQSLHQFLNN